MAKKQGREGQFGGYYDERSKPDFGSTPRVGQAAKAYVSGSNAHNVHQRPTNGPMPGAKGVSRADGPDMRGSGTARDLTGKPRGPR